MLNKLHLLSQDVPDGGQGVRWRKHSYLRIAASGAKGPAVFDWDERQHKDLEALWRDPTADGARERLARDLAAFCDKLSWRPDIGELILTKRARRCWPARFPRPKARHSRWPGRRPGRWRRPVRQQALGARSW